MNAHSAVAVFIGVAICLAASLAFTQPRQIGGIGLRVFVDRSFDGRSATLRDDHAQPLKGDEVAGTSWQLVKFQGSDEKTLTPDDGAKYTIDFAAGGRLTARIDCNRGSGTWKSSGPSLLQFGPLALTRAKCPAGSLHDQILKQWANIRSYVIKDGHLFLALMADGGIYEFEQINKSNPK